MAAASSADTLHNVVSGSWEVIVEATGRLRSSEYRVGDFAKKGLGAAKNYFHNKLKSDAPAEVFCNLGDVTIEAQVGEVRKKTEIFKYKGEAEVEVGKRFLVPRPQPGSGMVVRVWRVHVGVQPKALVGEATVQWEQVEEAGGENIELNLTRGDKTDLGFIRLSVQNSDAQAAPVFMDDVSEKEHSVNPLRKMVHGFRNKMVNQFEADLGISARRPLLHRDSSLASIGRVVVAIEGVSGLAGRVNKPVFIISLDGQEYRATRLAHMSSDELTYRFDLGQIDESVLILCYDDLATDRSKALGRIVVPLTDMHWEAGTVPGCGSMRDSLKTSLTRRYTFQFMPVHYGSVVSRKKVVDQMHYRAVIPGVPNSGLPREKAFGAVTLRIEMELDSPPKKSSVMKLYFSSLSANLREAVGSGTSPDVGSHVLRTKDAVAEPAEPEREREPSTLEILRSLDADQLLRNKKRLESFAEQPPTGLVRSLRENGRVFGGAMAALWLGFCVSPLFPPPLWSLPLYTWALTILNGYLSARQRAADWEDPNRAQIKVWEDEREKVCDTVKDTLEKLKGAISSVQDLTGNFAMVLERFGNMFSFADGPATVVCSAYLLFVMLATSAVLFVQSCLDPSGCWTIGLGGGFLLLGISWLFPKQRAGVAVKKDRKSKSAKSGVKGAPKLIKSLESLNKIFSIVPDRVELYHRYIVSRIQRVAEPSAATPSSAFSVSPKSVVSLASDNALGSSNLLEQFSSSVITNTSASTSSMTPRLPEHISPKNQPTEPNVPTSNAVIVSE
eukprot:TRINITY_DN16877_c0_g1_i1.p1 TRINITY_DN16877_c0_g1~~TRINITY_DN16877_c0_g1_i1.p1  ORF type:complete len:784 (-),score=151.89 TRINITY_DN16877_c0_g1_i1:52-2403(-)